MAEITSGQSNLTKSSIAAAHGQFNRIPPDDANVRPI